MNESEVISNIGAFLSNRIESNLLQCELSSIASPKIYREAHFRCLNNWSYGNYIYFHEAIELLSFWAILSK